MSEIGDAIHEKCMAFGDRVIKLNDYLLSRAANAKPSYKMVGDKRVYEKAVPVYLQSIANLSNQLLRAGTSIGANNAEATNAISKADFKSKSFIALKEAREALSMTKRKTNNEEEKIATAGWQKGWVGLQN